MQGPLFSSILIHKIMFQLVSVGIIAEGQTHIYNCDRDLKNKLLLNTIVFTLLLQQKNKMTTIIHIWLHLFG